MNTNLKRLISIVAFAGAAISASAQQFVLRGDGVIAGASKGPYDTAGAGTNIYFGGTLDPAGQHELTVSVGVIGWGESDVSSGYQGTSGTTTLWINDNRYDIPSDNTRFTFHDGTMTIDNGSVYHTDYRPDLAVVPVMVNYRFFAGNPGDRVRFFVGAGAGIATLGMSTELPRRFEGGWYSHHTETDSHADFTWNATAGVSIRVARRLTVDVNYAFQQLKGNTFNMKSVTYQLDDMNVSMGRVGMSWRF